MFVSSISFNHPETCFGLEKKEGIFPDLSNLKIANFSECSNLTDDNLLSLVSICKQIETIDLTCCDKLTYASIIGLARECSRLRVVNLSQCHHLTDSAIQELAMKCPLLNDLNISECKEITDAGVHFLGLHSKFLKTITLSLYVHPDIINRITDASAQSLASGCPLLEDVCFSGHEIITDKTAEHLSKLAYLRKVVFSDCRKITDVTAKHLSKCKMLESVKMTSELRDCVFTWKVVQYLSECPKTTKYRIDSFKK